LTERAFPLIFDLFTQYTRVRGSGGRLAAGRRKTTGGLVQNKRIFSFLFVAGAFAVLSASNAFGQTAQITGRVTDASGAVIAGAEVVVTNVATAASRTTQTNETGNYTVPLLPPGSYQVRASASGFQPLLRSGIVLEVEQRAEINFELEVGQVTEQIEVVADAAQLNTMEASMGQVIENKRVVDLPLNGRDYIQLALLSAGALQPIGGRFGGFSTAGQKTTQNNYMLDGIDNNSVELAGAGRQAEMVKPQVDAVQEFKVQTNAYAAEFGRAMGGVVNLTTKSGTNELHGTVFEFLRNEELDAKNFFDPADRPKPPFKRNQFGFSLGGPVVKNKTFLFGDYEGTRIRESRTATSTLPTLPMREGDFSQLDQQIVDPLTGDPFPNNQIPVNRQDALARDLIDLFPEPASPGLAANFVFQSPLQEDLDRWDIRADHHFTSKANIFWRLSRSERDFPAALALPAPAFGGGFDGTVDGWNMGAGLNLVLTPTLIASVRGGWNFSEFTRLNPASAGEQNLNEQFGVPAVDRSQPGGMASFDISGFRRLGLGAFNGVIRDSQNRQVAGDLTWVNGNHTLKFGANVLRLQNNIFNIRTEVGDFNFNGQFSNFAMSDFLLGQVSQFNWSTRLQTNLRGWHMGYYVQDDWKVSPRLTVNLGARYEVFLPWQDTADRMGNFDLDTDPANPRLILAGMEGDGRIRRSMISTDTDNIMPRVGLSYRIGEKTVIRTGYGIFYGLMEPSGDAQFLIGNPPFAFAVTQSASEAAPPFLLADGPAPGSLTLEQATGLTFSSFERDPDQMYNQQWNFNIQRQLGQDVLWEVGYTGSKASHLLVRAEGNFSPPGPGDLNEKRPIQSAGIPTTGILVSPLGPVIDHRTTGNSTYHALTTKLEKRFTKGYTVLVSYTWSRTIGDTCGFAAAGNTSACGFQDMRNLQLEKGLDNQHVPHRFVLSTLWELPFGRGKRWGSNWGGVADAILGGWSIGSIVTVSDGQPFNLTVAGNPANIGSNTIVNRPNVIGDPEAGEETVQRDFNIDAFAPNNQFQIGNLGRNVMLSRGFFNWDFSALKDFQITEDLRLQFRFEAFSATNTPRFGEPGNQVGTPDFGRITSAGTPRNLQFGLKLIF